MVNACPVQSDPRLKVVDFVSKDDERSIAGLVTEGLESLMDVVRSEIKKQEPDSVIVTIDRDTLSDEDITFQRDLESFLEKKLIGGKKINVLIIDDIPVIGWKAAMEKYGGPRMQVYYGSLACRQVPLCVKLF